MEYNQKMNLFSENGYCMPFNGPNEDVRLLKKYGNQEDGTFNHGVDLEANRYVLRAVADGVVTAIGTNKEHGFFQVTKYGGYEVTYGQINHVLVAFSKRVKAGSILAISGKSLHMEVKYEGQEIDPIVFLQMIFGNMKMNEAGNESGFPDFETLTMDIPTNYDDCQEEIEELMIRYYSDYLTEVADGKYYVPDRTEQSLRNIFSLSAIRNHFLKLSPRWQTRWGLPNGLCPLLPKCRTC